MKILKSKSLLLAGAATMALFMAAPVNADTVTKQTTVTQKDLPDTYKVNFAAMDLNQDGILSRSEVGRKLFYIFDTDGNEVIDNIEFGKSKVLTVIPLEKNQLTMVDFDDDGSADVTKYTSQEFAEFSMLNRFDADNDGLSAEEFIGRSFLKMDTNRDKSIDIKEWRDAYIASLSPKSAKQYRYNQ